MVDLLEDPEGAPYPQAVQEFMSTYAPGIRSAIDRGWYDENTEFDADLVKALESIAEHYREVVKDETFFVRYQVARLADSIEHGALRWEEPLPVPGVVEDLDKILAGREVDGLHEGCGCKWHEGERGKQRTTEMLMQAAQEMQGYTYSLLSVEGDAEVVPYYGPGVCPHDLGCTGRCDGVTPDPGDATEPAPELQVVPEGASEVWGEAYQQIKVLVEMTERAMRAAGADEGLIRRTKNQILFGQPRGPLVVFHDVGGRPQFGKESTWLPEGFDSKEPTDD